MNNGDVLTTVPRFQSLAAAAVLGAALSVVAFVRPALADDPKATLKEGVRLVAYGEASAAITLLSNLSPTVDDPKVQGQIQLYLGLAHVQNGSVLNAEKALTFALICDPSIRLAPARFKPQLIKRLEDIRAQPRGRLAIQGESNALVTLQGVPVGRLPVTLRLPLGEQTLKVHLESGKPAKEVRVNVQRDKRLVVDLKATQQTPAVDQPMISKPVPPATRPVVSSAVKTETKHNGVRQTVTLGPVKKIGVRDSAAASFWARRRVWTWVLLGVAAGAGAASLGLYVNAGTIQSDIDRIAYEVGIIEQDGETVEAALGRNSDFALLAAHQNMAAQDSAAVGLAVSAGVLAVGAAVLLFVEGRGGAAEQPRRMVRRLHLTPIVGAVQGGAFSFVF